jgi:putative aldouronate transport system permease protein
MVKRIKKTRESIAVSVVSYSIVTLFTITTLYPILNIISVAFSSFPSYIRKPWMFFPTDIDFTAFYTLSQNSNILISYKNTIFITVVGTLLTLFVTTITAYPLSRPQLRGKAIYMTLLIFTMMFSGGLIPTFLLIRGIGLYNSLWALIVPTLVSAYYVILMISFFKSLSESLLEAARIDGANEGYMLLHIVVPLSKPILATIALFAAVGYWNSYFSAIMYIRRQSLWPVQLVLREIIMAANTAMINAGGNMAEMDLANIPIDSLRYASLIVVMLPIMCIYPFLQKYFAKGVLLGAVKG